MISSLPELRTAGVLLDVDVAFAESMARLAGEEDARVLVAAALASRVVRDGDVCLDLPALCRSALPFEIEEGSPPPVLPEPSAWLDALGKSALVSEGPGDTPLVLDRAGRLYLRRYFEGERDVASRLLARASAEPPPCAEDVLQAGLARLFPASSAEPDPQRLAAQHAVRSRLCVISGGPGTGKTRTVARILALLIEQARALGQRSPRVELLAPTGKAAARLTESIRAARAELGLDAELSAKLRDDARTLHRALGLSLRGRSARAGQERPLGADVVIVDEASMVDIELMSKLLAALMPEARLILLGDRNQLASVEAGAVLGDICGRELTAEARHARPALARAISTLERSYRYGSQTAIGRLAQAIVRGDGAGALAVLVDPAEPAVTLRPHAPGRDPLAELRAAALAAFLPLHDAANDPEAKLAALERVRVLCALRRGPFGQLALNAALELELRARMGVSASALGYAGKPLLITRNDPSARLWNGDVGVLAPDAPGSDRLVAWFAGGTDSLRSFSAARLPPHESAYAMSVHKSQGSELDEVMLLLPEEPSPVLSRELLYTAVTRARSRVTIHGSEAMVLHAIEHPVRRASGLSELLWSPPRAPA